MIVITYNYLNQQECIVRNATDWDVKDLIHGSILQAMNGWPVNWTLDVTQCATHVFIFQITDEITENELFNGKVYTNPLKL